MGTTYRFHGSSELIQPESGLQTLYLLTPNHRFGGYSHAPHHTQSHHQSDGIDSGIFIMGSKYLKAAQQLLGEVVNVGNGREKEKVEAGSGGGQSSGKREGYDHHHHHHQLSISQRQELQMKKAKLVNMLDEVEQRFREYNHQMQIVVSSFEQAVGMGSAKMYTGLTLRTISKQFRCLKDGISTQIKATAKGLGEDILDHDHHLIRQQRALHQLGMMTPTPHNNAWRHQRGLPERAVSVLRAWLFEHFLHPYPKDSDKHMLAKQTGLTRSQVSNWFINARVRLWKPMVEEMYLEEIKQHEGDNMKTTDHCMEPNKELLGGSTQYNQHHVNINPSFPSHLEPQTLCTNIIEAIPKKPKANSYPSGIGNPNHFGGRFDHKDLVVDHANSTRGTGVSLTLGLPHCHETLTRHNFHSDQGFMSAIQTSHYMGMSSSASPTHSSTNIDSRKRFVAPLLPNFVV